MVQTTARDSGEQKVLDHIATYGWHCTNILEEGALPPWTFSIGFYSSWQFPELITIGLKRDTAHSVLGIVAAMLRRGAAPALRLPCDDLLENHSCRFVEVPKSQYREHVGWARWYYDGDDFPLYQIVWPSRSGHFPWEQESTPEFRAWQPVLGHASIVA